MPSRRLLTPDDEEQPVKCSKTAEREESKSDISIGDIQEIIESPCISLSS